MAQKYATSDSLVPLSSVIDAMGKPMTGFLQGNTHLVGNFDQCVDISGTSANGDVIKGNYVKLKLKVDLGLPDVYGQIVSVALGKNWMLDLG